MLTINHGDRLVLKALNVPGVVSSKNRIAYFHVMEGEKYRCSLNYTDPIEATFLVEERDILQVVDHMTNTTSYKYDISSGL
jgi:hypothetical protein